MNVKVGNNSIVAGDYTTYDGIRIGLLQRHTYNGSFLEFVAEKGFNCEIVYYETPTELSNALVNDEVDALVSSSTHPCHGSPGREGNPYRCHDCQCLCRGRGKVQGGRYERPFGQALQGGPAGCLHCGPGQVIGTLFIKQIRSGIQQFLRDAAPGGLS